MYTEEELLPLSGLQHLIFCERQCALIHVEQCWAESRLTAEGRILHERVHKLGGDFRKDIRVAYGLPLRSLLLGLVGKADVVEFRRKACEGEKEMWAPFPVEYKRGRPKSDNSDKVQLCAQAMCLEEMLEVSIERGALFYGKTRRRLTVVFDESLRKETAEAAERFHALVESGETPKAVFSKRCNRCSMVDLCLPKTAGKGRSAARYLFEALAKQ